MYRENYFFPRSAAQRYAKGRPYYHPQVLERMKKRLAAEKSFDWALDSGCGTGMSAVALKAIARRIVGIDLSPAMIALAPTDPQIRYCVSPAERLPIRDDAVDLITLASVFHWIDGEKFFSEARRVLRADGWLVIYYNAFAGSMAENADFQGWYQEIYLARYPSPPGRTDMEAAGAAREGFRLQSSESYENTVRFSIRDLIDYLITQSNIIAAVEGGRETVEESADWLTQNIRPLFGHRMESTFSFRGGIWYLQKFG